MTSRPRNATLCPGVHRSCPSRCLVWLQAKAGGPSCEHPLPWLEGSGFLNPETRSQLLPLAPVPRCHRVGLLPLPSCLAPGAASHMLHLGRQRGSLAMASLSRRLDRPQSSPASLASARSALPPQRGSGRGWGGGWPGVPPGGSQPAFSRGGWQLPQCHALQVRSSGGTAQGAGSILRPSAAASFELPTPLWSLYMLPEETVSTA